MRRNRLIALVLVFLGCLLALCLSLGRPSLLASPATAQTSAQSVAYVPTTDYQGAVVPDWSRTTWSSLPPVQENGSLTVPPDWIGKIGYNPSRSWVAGQTLDQHIMLGDIQDAFQAELFSLDNIAQLAGLNPEKLALSNLGLANWQSISALVKAVPNLGQFPLRDIQPIFDLVRSATRSDTSSLASLAMSELLRRNPAIADLKLGRIPLDGYNLTSIPNLTSTPLLKFAGWQQSTISQVPGLNAVPFDRFPISPLGAKGAVAKLDVVYGPAESNSIYNVVSGSQEQGFHVPCVQPHCAYVELNDLTGNNGALHGARWIKGGKASQGGQMVRGGRGALSRLNGGKEPTGRLPFGPAFKVVLTDTDEATGRADYGLYFRACADLAGCSPYFIGPVPFLSLHENDPVFLGIDGIAAPAPNVNIPESIRRQVEDIENQYGPEDSETAFSDDCVRNVLSRAPPSMLSAASRSVPLILSEAQKAGLSPAQTAYVLATAQHESGMGRYMRELGVSSSAYDGYTGKGYVQLTWKSNYQYWSNRLGMDLVSHPDRAADPRIAAKILVLGMRDGTFTGVGLRNYINGSEVNFWNARSIVNGTDRADLISGYAGRYYQALKGCASAATGSVTARGVPGKIAQVASRMRGMDTSVGPDGGNLACAWSVNKILKQSIGRTIGRNTNYVPSVEAALLGGEGVQINRAQASAGDIVIAQNQSHIGLCQNNGCSRVISNSSSRAKFAWESDTNFGGFYGSGASRIYRVK